MKEKLIKYFKDNELIKKSLITIIIRGLGVILSFGIMLFITNNFEAGLVGKYEISRSILNIFGTLTLVGLNEAIIYYSGYFRAKNSFSSIIPLYKKMVLIIFCAFIAFFLLYILVLNRYIHLIYDENVKTILLKTFGILGFHALAMLNIDYYRALNKIEISEVFRNFYRHAFFILALVGITLTQRYEYLIDVYLLNYVLLGIVSTFFVFRSFRKLEASPHAQFYSYKNILKRSVPMSVSFAAFLILQSTDILVLGKYSSYDNVAYYSVTIQLTKLISVVLYAVNAAYATKIAELYELRSVHELKVNVKKSTRLIFILTAPVVLVMLLFSDFFLGLFGDSYTAAKPALNILLIGQIMNSATGTIGMYMNMTGNQNRLQNILLISIFVNLILNLVMIPKYGMVGAAISTAATTIGWNVYCAWYLFKKKGIKTFLH